MSSPLSSTEPVEALHDLALFDANVLGAMFDHDAQLIGPLLKTFVDSTNAGLADLSSAISNQNQPGMVSIAHRIAGASRLSGAVPFGDVAAGLEAAAKRLDMTVVHMNFQQLTQLWPLVQRAMGPLPPG